MTLLVTGGAGYIGSVCVETLLNHGYTAVVIDSLQTGFRESLPPEVPFYQGDCGDRALLDVIFSSHAIDGVLHFAASTQVEESMADPGTYFRNNVVKGITLLDTMLAHTCRRFIFSSTAAIFGEPAYLPVDEDHPKAPVNPYGASKLLFETILDWYHRAHGLAYASLRYFNAAGATTLRGDGRRKPTLIIPVIIQVLLGQRDRLTINGKDYPTRDGTCIRDYIHVIDLAEAHILALENLQATPAACYNLGNGKGCSNLQVLQAAEAVSNTTIPWSFGPRRPGDPAELISASDKARAELGWNPRYENLETIVRSAWEWHRRHPEGYRQ
ncbi:MAG: UDP-glucose 4-epimerase GalE [Syntrophales bacterium]|jgi:UDP-glucose 4-epimerase|nr:UDP-glucose 4-epimerase GalE [Syntrophales bacterium]MCK9528561.1 UDP-glucose 4-epimerase GalE [Syntrophales bacterium]MDX9922803.1 UDP-glucose 4-epimerase GalE [Syntrophales bacterium]